MATPNVADNGTASGQVVNSNSGNWFIDAWNNLAAVGSSALGYYGTYQDRQLANKLALMNATAAAKQAATPAIAPIMDAQTIKNLTIAGGIIGLLMIGGAVLAARLGR